jgi:hypothetical protein
MDDAALAALVISVIMERPSTGSRARLEQRLTKGDILMPRLPLVERDQAPHEVQEAYDKAQMATGSVSNFVKLIANHAKSLPAFLEWYPKLRDGALDIKFVKASQLNGCNY